MSRWFFFISLFFVAHRGVTQTNEGNNDCTYAKEIRVPFSSADKEKPAVKPLLNQTVFYNYRDQFSFWYKILVKENSTISFSIKPINDSDEYAVYVYQYDAADFCTKVYYQKWEPMKASFFTKGASKENPYDLKEKTFQAKKEHIYYISVLNTSMNNCGHQLYLKSGSDTLRVKALHLPCKRDLSSLSPMNVALQAAPEKKDTLLTTKTTVSQVLQSNPILTKDSLSEQDIWLHCFVKDPTMKNIQGAKLSVWDQLTKEESKNIPDEKYSYQYQLVPGRSYKVKCAALGYKESEQMYTADKKKTDLNIIMEPLKEGENIIMKSIYFFPNTYALKKNSVGELQILLAYLQANNNVRIEIQGHTNGDHRIAKNKAYSTLGEEWNYEGTAKNLSQLRAEAIKKYLETNGVSSDRLEAKGYGGKRPIVKNPESNEEGQYNIRVELVILKS